ncbi:acyl carrier protein [Goodfellowiella coeruleoviolacea]|uniref:Acyl carrier protein n=1 Tax=Goodfellowiella coeruleoviolacea TaxID=334858 RepID=A0AAE3KIG0_9PSEU|nr:acyl carrier protein [Goodfellowiella coeruleoviolacea]MCP2168455.1 Acyl carrier protein [Goodfellowiella coeruleoviolacea]
METVVGSRARSDIREFIQAKFPGARFTDSDDIFGLGFATSLFAMQLVMFVEQRFGFQVDNDDLDLANFRSVDAMAALVARAAPAAVEQGVAGGTGA